MTESNLTEIASRNPQEIQKLLEQHEQSARMLVRRDLELTRANEKLRALDRMKSEFVAVAAHQLRTPLSAVKWSFKLLIDGDLGELTPDQRSILVKGYESNERMIKLVNDLLDVDHIESGKMTYNFQAVQIIDIINNLITELYARAHDRGVNVVLDPSHEQLPLVKADPGRIRAVLQNLIENAIKYTPRAGSVDIRLASQNGVVKVIISDTGIGIPEGEVKSIFSKFFRGKHARKIETDGSGLGLFISREIVNRHGGRLWFESKEGAGTTFFFTLPVIGIHENGFPTSAEFPNPS